MAEKVNLTLPVSQNQAKVGTALNQETFTQWFAPGQFRGRSSSTESKGIMPP